MELVDFLRARLDEDEALAREASGSTVVGERGNWRPSPSGDEWEASQTDCDETELLVALRPGLPRPVDVMSGYWGAVVCDKPDDCDPDAASPLRQLQHAARHDPARVLAEVEAKRRIVFLATQIPALTAKHNPFQNDADGWAETLKQLALPYADHPDYREEWRP